MQIIDRRSWRHRVLVSLLLITIGAAALTSTVNTAIAATALGRIDRFGERYLQDTLQRAAATFAVVRGLNGLISVLQDTQLAVSPAGLGVSLGIGEILDPVNDLLERFSWVMLLSTVALGLQLLLQPIGIWLGFDILLAAAMLVTTIGIWAPPTRWGNFRPLGMKLLVLAFLVRFAIPLSAAAGQPIYRLFLAQPYAEATASLDRFNREIKATGQLAPPASDHDTMLDEMKAYYRQVTDIVQLRERLEALKTQLTDYVNHMVRLTVIFLLQTVLIPLFVLWLLKTAAVRRLTGS